MFSLILFIDKQANGLPDDKWRPSPIDTDNTRDVVGALPALKDFFVYLLKLFMS